MTAPGKPSRHSIQPSDRTADPAGKEQAGSATQGQASFATEGQTDVALAEAQANRAIDRTLAALSRAEPAPAMQARLLAALQAHQAATSAPSLAFNHAPSLWWRRFLAWKALAPATAVLLFLLAASLWHRPHPHPGAPPSPTASSSAKVGPPPPALPEATHPLARPFDRSAATFPLLDRTAAKHSPLNQRPQSGSPASSLGGVEKAAVERPAFLPPPMHLEAHLTSADSPLEQQALADLHAPSQLAPSLPPTAQERLVLLMLRRGEKHNLAQLDPIQQAAFDEQQRAARQNFFDPPLLPDPNHVGVPQ